MITKYYLYFGLSCMAVAAGCSNSPNKATIAAPTAVEAPKVLAPFRYHKSIEVAPGQSYDILSWGRGSQTVGAFEILRSDSAAMKYTTTTGDLEGSIKDVLNADMDNDGNPEIFIHTQATDSTNAAKVFAFEYNNDKARELDFPRLTRSQRKGYRGNDNFFVKDGNLMREFNVYEESDSLAKKPVQKRLIQYNLSGGSISADQISQDSTLKESATGPAVVEKSKSENNSSNTQTRKSSSRKRSSSVKKKSSRREISRKRRRHR
jgi:CRISPR/Cas system-associated protein endoribonuclease Cas2